MLIFSHPRIRLLQAVEIFADRQFTPALHGDRNSVDEQSQYLVSFRQTVRAARHSSAKHDSILSCVPLQKQSPGCLHKGIERHTLPLYESLQATRFILVHPRINLSESRSGVRLA